MLDFSRSRLVPFAHQREDTEWLIAHPYALIASEMRTGKTKIVIDAAQFMFEAGTIDTVIVVAPAPVRDVWADRALGEIAKHLWEGLPATVTEYHARIRTWLHGGIAARKLDWYVTNFEFIRSKNRLAQLMPVCGPRTLLVLDESSFVKNHAAQQTKACLQLRRACGRVVLLNGTPIFHSPMDLFSQGNLLHPSILDCRFITYFKARYAIQEPILAYGGKPLMDPYGKAIQKIAGWTNLGDLQRRFAPYTVRRLQKDCLDLPPKLDPVTLTATLTEATWRAYRDMRDELVVWLRDDRVATGATAAVRVMRLAQITSGFIGGIEDACVGAADDGLLESLDLSRGQPTESVDCPPDAEGLAPIAADEVRQPIRSALTQEIGREKLDVLLWFLGQMLEREEHPKVVAWCRFRAELERVERDVAKLCTCGHSLDEHEKDNQDVYHKCRHHLCSCQTWVKQFRTALLWGGQKRAERLAALALLKPETSPDAPVFAGGTFGTGSFGLDMTAAHTSVALSSDYSPGKHAQAADRVYGPGQVAPVAYFDVVAVGPRGQKTIDHAIVAARRAGEDLAAWTSEAWVRVLEDE